MITHLFMLQRKSVLRQYLSYFVLLFLLTTLPPFIVFGYFTKQYRSELVTSNRSQIIKTQTLVDSYLEQISNIYYQLEQTPDIISGNLNEPQKQLKLQKQLEMLRAANVTVDDLFYFKPDLDVAVSSRLVLQLSNMSRYYTRYDNWTQDQLLTDLAQTARPYWRPFETLHRGPLVTETVLSGIFPLGVRGQYNQATLLIQIKESTFKRIIGLSAQDSGVLTIYDQNKQVIYSSATNAVGLPPEAVVQQIFADQKVAEDSSVRNFEAGPFLYTQLDSEVTQWTLVYAFPLQETLSKLQQWKEIYIICMILVSLAGALLIAWAARKMYSPIRELSLFAGQTVKMSLRLPQKRAEKALHSEANEIMAIKDAMHYLNDVSRKLEGQLSLSRPQIRALLMLQLLQGKYSDVYSFNQVNQASGLTFNDNTLCAVAVRSSNHPFDLTKWLPSGFNCYPIDFYNQGAKVYLCTNSAYDKVLTDCLTNLINIWDPADNPVYIGISTAFTDLRLTYRACMEAVLALEQMQIKTETTPSALAIFNSTTIRQMLYYPSEELALFRESLDRHDIQMVSCRYDAMLEYLNHLKTHNLLKYCVCFDMINAMLKVIMEENNQMLPLDIMEPFDLGLYPNQDVESEETLVHTLRQMKQHLLNKWGSETPSDLSVISQIMAYIEKHYMERDFSAQQVAEAFHMSLPRLSQFFKKEKKINLLTYIQTRKMNDITALLLNSDLTINEIAELAGYTSTSSFIRQFRRQMGSTPGEFRRNQAS